MRIATWNLERPVQRARRKRIEGRLQELAADIWVFTETLSDLQPGVGYNCVTSSGTDRLQKENEVWVAIWSRHPMTALEVSGDKVRTAAALVHAPDVRPFVVFGSVLPWRGDLWRNHPSAGAVAFEAALDAQRTDWIGLKATHGDVCIAGDFNQDLSGKPYYWTKRARALLQASLAETGLRAVTADPDPVRMLTDGAKASIDHICVPAHWSASSAEAWDKGSGPLRLCDHFGIAVNVRPRPR